MEILLTVWNATANYVIEYISDLQKGIALFFTLKNIFAVFGGVTIGTFCGAVPGMTITMAVLSVCVLLKMQAHAT